MLDMPILARRKVQDAVRQMQEEFARHTGARQQVNSLHRQRMTCADSIQAYTNNQDWTNGMGISPSGRFRVIEEAKPRRKVFTKEGIRWDAAWIILAAVFFLCAAILLADLAGMGLGSSSIGRLNAKIEEAIQKNEELKQELAVNAGDAAVVTKAVALDLVSAYGVQTYYLTVPQAPGAAAVTSEARSASTGWMSSHAGD